MKKVLALVMIAGLALLATSCAKKQETAAAKTLTKETVKVGFVYIGTINDEGYTQAHDQGRLALNEMGINTAYIEHVPENADCEKAIRDLIDQGCNVIYTNSFGYMDWTIKVAADHPEVYFGHCSGYKRADNVSTYFGKVFQARYLSGIAAGLKTKANKIGYVAAMPIPEVIRGINAFTLGVQSVNPAASVEVIWTNTWFDPAVEKQAALELLNKGCDVMSQHQDTTAPQIAAQEKGAFAIGYNSPTYSAAPAAYLTAPLFKWATFYVDDVNQILAGTWTSRAYWEGFDKDMVALDELSANCAPGTAEKIAAAKAGIVDGSLKIFSGPLADQSGAEKVSAGSVMTDDEIWNMSWFVKGVVGSIPN
ncbi:MAG: BMP family ABC transporter substrate-binding protein [Spirochaetales bacterium]|nr:BMP family ABC transporter substrate-binding protein [Spirochaetales bacterium]HPO02238.1 BMP family ABC transporter substrate-binding protein [Treponemataceae bacterium]